MQEIKSSKLIVNKSKFFGHLYNIDNLDEIKGILNQQKKNYKKANHHCYAVLLDKKDQNINIKEEIAKSDGEVGHPGKVLLQILKDNNLNNHCVIVSRIFGGINLGPGGVSRAFRECGQLLTKDL
ncbi:MAG: YigZ family protein [Nanoarchaeota archaeon]|nr:YigZ family protein [Nanoarchaeota archaeon]